MPIIDLNDITGRELAPGFTARFVHTENMTLAYWEVKAGAALPDHQHPHEQVTNLLEGEFEFTLDGETTRLSPGRVVIIPGGVPHSGTAVTDCRVLDVFYPVREDYQT